MKACRHTQNVHQEFSAVAVKTKGSNCAASSSTDVEVITGDKLCQDLTVHISVCKVAAPVTMVTWQLRWWNSRRGRPIWEMTHSWCRNNFFLPGRHTQTRTSACVNAWCHWGGGEWSCIWPWWSQWNHSTTYAPVRPTCSLGAASKADPHDGFIFLLCICKPQKNQNSSRVSSNQSLICSRHSCMFHTHSMITFVLCRKGKGRARLNICLCCTGADFLWEQVLIGKYSGEIRTG